MELGRNNDTINQTVQKKTNGRESAREWIGGMVEEKIGEESGGKDGEESNRQEGSEDGIRGLGLVVKGENNDSNGDYNDNSNILPSDIQDSDSNWN